MGRWGAEVPRQHTPISAIYPMIYRPDYFLHSWQSRQHTANYPGGQRPIVNTSFGNLIYLSTSHCILGRWPTWWWLGKRFTKTCSQGSTDRRCEDVHETLQIHQVFTQTENSGSLPSALLISFDNMMRTLFNDLADESVCSSLWWRRHLNHLKRFAAP